MGTMRQRGEGRWELRAFVGRDEQGRPRQVSRSFRGTKTAARKELARLETEVNDGKLGRADTLGVTVGTLLERYLRHLESEGRAPKTLTTYRYYVRRLAEDPIVRIKVRRLTTWDLDELDDRLAAAGRSPAVRLKVHTLLSGALKQATRWGMCPVNVAGLARKPKAVRTRIVVPSVEEVRAIIAEAERRDPILGAAFMLAALTGVRRGELCALRWTDLDLDAGTLTVARSISETPATTRDHGAAEGPTKTHQVRTMALDGAAVAMLRRHRAHAEERAAAAHGVVLRPDGFVFSLDSLDGSSFTRPDKLSKVFADVVDALGLRLTLHSLRHFVATQLAASGDHAVRTIAGRLGHADASVTLRTYAEWLPAADRAAADHLGRVLSSGGPGTPDLAAREVRRSPTRRRGAAVSGASPAER
jgi:integrase